MQYDDSERQFVASKFYLAFGYKTLINSTE